MVPRAPQRFLLHPATIPALGLLGVAVTALDLLLLRREWRSG